MSWLWSAVEWVFMTCPLAIAAALWIALGLGHFVIGKHFSMKIAATFHAKALAHIRKEKADEFYAGDREWIGGVRWQFSDGGFYRVLHVFDASYSERLSMAPISKFYYAALAIIACVVLTLVLRTFPENPRNVAELTSEGLFFSAIVGLVIAYDVLFECGVQWILYPKVLDPAPISISRRQVHAQKAMGDARISGESESVDAASAGGSRRSPVHDQKF